MKKGGDGEQKRKTNVSWNEDKEYLEFNRLLVKISVVSENGQKIIGVDSKDQQP